jgi:hypothetical protein
MPTLKRISMAGSDVAVTDAEIADLVLEYAMFLGRVGRTDVVTVPVVGGRGQLEVNLLLGPSSQIVLSVSEGPVDADMQGVEEARADLRSRIGHVSGRNVAPVHDEAVPDLGEAFPDFDSYESS